MRRIGLPCGADTAHVLMLLILLSPFAAAFALARTVRPRDLFVLLPVAALTSVAAWWRVVTVSYPTVDSCGSVGDVYLLSSAAPAVAVGGVALFSYTAVAFLTLSSRSPVARGSFTRAAAWWGVAAVVLAVPVVVAVVTGEVAGWEGTSVACLVDVAAA